MSVLLMGALVLAGSLAGDPASASPLVVTADRLVSHNAAGQKGDNSSFVLYGTPDLEQLFLGSQADNLVPSAQDAQYAVHYYIADTAADTLAQYDLDADGLGTSAALQIKTVSKDLRYVLQARPLGGGQFRDELVDRAAGTVKFNPCGLSGEHCESAAAFTLDDKYLIFNVRDLGTYNVPIGTELLVSYELATGHTEIRATTAVQSNDQVAFNVHAGSGDWIYYNTYNRGLTGDATQKSHIVRENLASGQVQVIDATPNGVVGDRDANDFNVSPDGGYITFNTLSTNLAVGDADGQWRPYLKDLSTGALTPLARHGSGPNFVTTASGFQLGLGAFTADDSLVICSQDPLFVPEGVGAALRSPDGTLRWFSSTCPSGISLDGHTQVYLQGPTADDPDYQGQQVRIAPVVFPGPADTVPPVVVGTPDHTPNSHGWTPLGTIITWSSTDPAPSSGAPTVPPATTVVSEGAHQSIRSGTSCDPSLNCATGVVEVSVDATPPVLTAATDQVPNQAGWFASDVRYRWTCSDALSGIDGSCPDDSIVSGEGVGLVASASVSDRAGNVAIASAGPINVDATAPVTVVDAPTTWVNHSVTVGFSAADNLSGVAGTSYSVDGGALHTGTSATIDGEGVHTISYRSTDLAGNVEVTRTTRITLDYSGPTVRATLTPAPNSANWNNTPVTVSATCEDSDSGVASCSLPVTVSTEGKNQQVTIAGTDNAGNVSSRMVVVNVDRTSPVVTLNGPTTGSTYLLGTSPAVSCSTNDLLSGVAVAAAPTTTRSATGDFTSKCEGALDAADNGAPVVTATYRVVPSYSSLLALTYQYVGDDSHPTRVALAHSLSAPGCGFLAQIQVLGSNGMITQNEAAELAYWDRIYDPRCA